METTYRRTIETVARDGGRSERQEEMLKEYRLDLLVNGKNWKTCMCTCTDLEELVLGRLFEDGRIENLEDVKDCRIDEMGHRAEVMIEPVTGMKQAKENRGPFAWKEEWVFSLADVFAQDTKLHRRTSCTHSCFLAERGTVLYVSEDIGRHNAMDKAVGWAIKNGVFLGKCMLFTSGRISSDMIRKVIRARIPLVASNAAPTEEAVELAEECGIILVGAAKQNRMKIFCAGKP